MADYSLETLAQFSLNDLERMYREGRVSEDQMHAIADQANQTPGRFYWYEWRDGAFRQYDKDAYDLIDGRIRRGKSGRLTVY